MSIRIDKALISRFKTANFGLPTAYEGLPLTPSNGVAYAEVTVIPNNETAYSADDTDETDGLFRIILRYPENEGAVPAKTMADTMFAQYKIGQRITYDGQEVEITGRQRAPGVREAGWYKLVLSISYRTFTRRN